MVGSGTGWGSRLVEPEMTGLVGRVTSSDCSVASTSSCRLGMWCSRCTGPTTWHGEELVS